MGDTQPKGGHRGLIVAILLAGVLVAASIVAAAWMVAPPRYQMQYIGSGQVHGLYLLDSRTGAVWVNQYPISGWQHRLSPPPPVATENK